MSHYDPLDARADPFHPPDIPVAVGCLHCGQEYESDQIEWRVERDAEGRPRGFWCCPISGCGGCGFGFDILPLDHNYRDERGGWVSDDDDDDDDEEGEYAEDAGLRGDEGPPGDEDEDEYNPFL